MTISFANRVCAPASPAGASAEDWKFCATMLPKVSRTFALSIGVLPPQLREAIRVSYLLCRIVDTIEDDAVVIGPQRERLYDMFDVLMDDDGADPSVLERLTAENALGAGSDDHTLCLNAGSVFRCFRELPIEQRTAIRPHVLEMSRGMREFTRRADLVGRLRLRDLDELERYCYFVAGTVGKLLTALFEDHLGDLPQHLLTPLRARSVSFGLALQLVNIVKDVAEDLPRGDCFLPEDLATEQGVKLDEILEPSHRAAGMAIIGRVCDRARDHLKRAEQYTVLWPAESGAEIRMFCTVPLVLALATLREVERGDNALVPGKTPKITRKAVTAIFADAQIAIRRNDTLRWMIGYYAGGAYLNEGAMPAPAKERVSTMPAKLSEAPADVPPAPPLPSIAPPTSQRMPIVSAPRGEEPTDETAPVERKFRGLVLVTGGAGHLGANLVRRLLADDRQVRVLLRQGSNNVALDGLTVERVYGDLREQKTVHAAVSGCETIFHCAAMVSTLQGSAKHKRDIYESNVIGTQNLLASAKVHGVRRVVCTGSFSATGHDLDDASRAAGERQPFFPFKTHLPYARSKVLSEHECLRAYADGLDVVMVTSTAILGPHDYKPSRMGRTLLDHAQGKLRAYIPGGFEFVATRDIVNAHMLAMDRGRAGQKYTIASRFLSLDEVMQIFEDVTGVPRPRLKLPPQVMHALANVSSAVLGKLFPSAPQRFTPDAVRILQLQRRADTSKARTELGFVPTDIRDAVREAYDDFARRGLLPSRAITSGVEASVSVNERAHAKVDVDAGAAA